MSMGRSGHELGALGGSNDADSCESSGQHLHDRAASKSPLLVHELVPPHEEQRIRTSTHLISHSRWHRAMIERFQVQTGIIWLLS